MGRLVGVEPKIEVTDATIGGVTIDNTKRLELLGPTTVDWHDGIRRMIAAQHPELLESLSPVGLGAADGRDGVGDGGLRDGLVEPSE